MKGKNKRRKNKREREREWREGREKGRRLEMRRETYIPIDFLFLGTKELCLDPSWSKLMRPVPYVYHNIPKYFVTYCQIRLDLIFYYKTIAVVLLLRCVQLFKTPWSLARQVSLSMAFPRQGNRSGLSFPYTRRFS